MFQKVNIHSGVTYANRKVLRYAFIAWLSVFIFSACKTQEESTHSTKPVDPREQFKTLFHEAMSEKMVGHYDRAVTLFEQCLSIEPENGAVNFALSELYILTGNVSKALIAGQAAYKSDNTNKWYALNLAQLYYRTGDFLKSAEYYEIALQDDEPNIELKYQYTDVLILSQQYEKAIAMLNEIETEIGRIPEFAIAKYEMYMIIEQPEKAQQEINLLLSENPKDTEMRKTLGIYYLGQDQFEKARLMGEEMIAINPDAGEGYFLTADAEIRLKNTQRGFDLYKQGFAKSDISLDRKLELLWTLSGMPFDYTNPDAKIAEQGLESLYVLVYDASLKNQTLHTYYGTFLLNQGKSEKALEQFKIVCDLNASDFSFWNQLLFLEQELSAFEFLYTDAQKAIELFPSQPVFYLHTGIGAYETKRYTEAEEFLFLGKDLVVNNPSLLADFYIHLGIMEFRQNHQSAAYAYFDQADQSNPTDAKATGIKAYYLYLDGKYAEANTSVSKGLLINPLNAQVLHAQGVLFLQQKNFTKALESLEMAAIHEPRNGLILEHYGDALFLTGAPDKALQMWIEASRHGNKSALLNKKIADKNYYEN
ncbi:MAG: tetratricopeptide repeat protein [Crocinitomicaceae bacterium]|nr:tetratricopeptide repeat protein [Crocinitomicaceae bacterium]